MGKIKSVMPFVRYTEQLVERGVISSDVKDTAWRLWQSLQSRTGKCLPEPDVVASDDQRLMLAFDDGVRHLEFEIGKNKVEVFFLCRDDGKTWESELDGCLILDNDLLDKVNWFAK
jgi:hypothetical protein